MHTPISVIKFPKANLFHHLDRFYQGLLSLRDRLILEHQIRKDSRHLKTLGEHQLRDIGIRHDEIDRVVRGITPDGRPDSSPQRPRPRAFGRRFH